MSENPEPRPGESFIVVVPFRARSFRVGLFGSLKNDGHITLASGISLTFVESEIRLRGDVWRFSVPQWASGNAYDLESSVTKAQRCLSRGGSPAGWRPI